MTAEDAGPRRRDVLAGVGLSFAGVALAGCDGQSTDRTDGRGTTESRTKDEESQTPSEDVELGGIAPQPLRNKRFEGRSVHTATGEFTPVVTDFDTPGRGEASFSMTRKYRSALADQAGLFGRGWTWTYDKRVHRDGDAIVFETGRGEQYRFQPAETDGWTHPQFYAVFAETDAGVELRYADGTRLGFATPEDGGRLRRSADSSGNAYRFDYGPDAIRITTPRDATVTLRRDADGRIVAAETLTGETWEYRYGGAEDAMLTAVVRPDGSTVQYSYDEAGLLVAIQKPGDQTPYLENDYEWIDGAPRILQQRHGDNGGTFDFWYERVDRFRLGDAVYPVYRTHVARKDRGEARDQANLHLTHDTAGLVVERELEVDTAELASEAVEDGEAAAGTASLTTRTTYNAHLESVEREFPAGNIRRWRYDTDATDPRARGNLTSLTELAATDRPAPHESAQLQITWADVGGDRRIWRRVEEVDPDGNRREFAYTDAGLLRHWRVPEVEHYDVTAGPDARTTRAVEGRYAYNDYGQLVRREEWGAVTEYDYYGADAYGGPAASELEGQDDIDAAVADGGGGLLARVRLNAGNSEFPSHLRDGEAGRIRTSFVYDRAGEITARVDGEGNAARVERDALGRATAIVDRTGARQSISRDPAGNVTGITHAFDRNEVADGTLRRTTSDRTVFWEYDQLDNVTAFGRRGEEIEHRIELERDANENVVARHRGEQTVRYRYGDRNLLIERTWAAGTADESSQTFRYARDGKPLVDIDADGTAVRRTYGGLRRLRTTEFANGLVAQQSHSQAGYLDSVRLHTGESSAEGGCTLAELRMERDAAGRIRRTTRRRETAPEQGCEPLGRSEWDGQSGAVTQVIEYEDAGPKRVWEEPGAVTTYRYDDAGRLLARQAPAGATTVFNYDGRNALTRAVRVDAIEGSDVGDATAADGGQHYREFRLPRDRKGRPTGLVLNGEPKHEVEYNDNDQVIRLADAEQHVWPLHDAVGRTVGTATRAGPSRADGEPTAEDEGDLVAKRRELDALDRTRAVIDPEGGRRRVRYDRRNNPTEIQYPDGTTESASYGPAGNLREWTDPAGTTFQFEYDALKNLIAETARSDAGSRRISYRRDTLGRLRTATDETTGVTVERQYDSLGNPLQETVQGRTLTRSYDSAGNVTAIGYPGGPAVRNAFDDLSRLTNVETGAGDQVWAGRYDAEYLEDEVYGDGVVFGQTDFETDCSASRISQRRFEDGDGRVLGGATYQYAPDGSPKSRTWLRPGENLIDTFDHDTTKRVTRVDHGLGHSVEYGYSRLDTIEAVTVQDDDTQERRRLAPSTDADYRPATFGSARFTHDVNLNRVAETGHDVAAPGIVESECSGWEYEYDVWNRLTTARCLDAEGDTRRRIEWRYDPLNRPIRKTVDEGDSERREQYAWADHQLLKRWTTRGLGTATASAVGSGTTANCDTETTLLYGRTLAEIITESDESDGDESDEETADCPTGDWFVLDDGKGNNVGAVDPAGQLDEEVVYDGLGMPVQTVSPDEIGRSNRIGRIDSSLFPTLDAAGTGVLDTDVAPTGRENHFGDLLDPRNQGMFGGRRGRTGAGLTTGVEDLAAEFGAGSQRRAGGRRAWTRGSRSMGGTTFGSMQLPAGVSKKQAKEGLAKGAKMGAKALENDGSSKVGKQKGPGIHNGVGVSGSWGNGEGVKGSASVTIGGQSASVSFSSFGDFVQWLVSLFSGGSNGTTGTDTGGTSTESTSTSEGGETTSGSGEEAGDAQTEQSETDANDGESTEDGGKTGDDESGDEQSDDGDGSDETKEESDDSAETDQQENGEGGGETGTSDSTNAEEKGSETSTPTPSGGPGGCGPAMGCRGTGEMGVILPGQSRSVTRDGPCGPAMLCRDGGGVEGQIFGLGIGGRGGGGPDCRRMLCRSDSATSGPFVGGSVSGVPGVCRYAMCRDGGVIDGIGPIDVLGTQVGSTVPTTHLGTFAPTGSARYHTR